MLESKLQTLLNKALNDVKVDRRHNLSLTTRILIYKYLVETSEDYLPFQKLGWLGVKTVQKVLPTWQKNLSFWDGLEEEFGDINVKEVPFLMLKLLEDMLNGVKSLEEAKLEIDEYHGIVGGIGDELLEYGENGPKKAVGVSDAAYSALLMSTQQLNLNLYSGWENHTDDTLPTEMLDMAGAAMLAYAGGNTFGRVNFKKRLEFWEWWLTEAVPQSAKLPSK